MDSITVTQADREAAAAYWQVSRIGNDETQRRYLSGEADEAFIVQAFARHAATARAETAALVEENARLRALVERAQQIVSDETYVGWHKDARAALAQERDK